jgi:hypothetical protein
MAAQRRLNAVEILLVVCGVGLKLCLARPCRADRIAEGADLKVGQSKVGFGLIDRGPVRRSVDHEQQLVLLDVLIVLHRQLCDWTTHMGCDANHVGAHVRVVGTGIYVVKMRNLDAENIRAGNYQRANNATGNPHTETVPRRCGNLMAGSAVDSHRRGTVAPRHRRLRRRAWLWGNCGTGIGRLPSHSIEEHQIEGTAEQKWQARVNQKRCSEVRFDPAGGKDRPKPGGKHRADDRAEQPCGKIRARDIDHRIARREGEDGSKRERRDRKSDTYKTPIHDHLPYGLRTAPAAYATDAYAVSGQLLENDGASRTPVPWNRFLFRLW